MKQAILEWARKIYDLIACDHSDKSHVANQAMNLINLFLIIWLPQNKWSKGNF